MSESGVGLSVAETRQNAGRSSYWSAEFPLPPGRVNAPAATFCALVIVASGNVVDAILSHAGDAISEADVKASASEKYGILTMTGLPSSGKYTTEAATHGVTLPFNICGAFICLTQSGEVLKNPYGVIR